MAVAFFFVLGGFSMTLGYKDRVLNPRFSYMQYITRRCIKFYPLHWLCLIAVLPLSLLSFKTLQIPLFFINAALLQSWIPEQIVYFSFNSVSWYLADTMFFALVFPLVCKWVVNAGVKGKVMIAALFAGVYALIGALIPVEQYHAVLYISPYMRLMDFVFGIFVALIYLRLKLHPKIAEWHVSGSIIVLSLIVLLVVESCLLPETAKLFAPVYWVPVGALILVASLLCGNRGGWNLLENKYLHRLGEISFVVFMIHQIVLRYTTLVFEKILHLENNIIYALFTFIFTIVLSMVVKRYILNPTIQWLTKSIQPFTTARS